MSICYKSGYKYQLCHDYSVRVGIQPGRHIATEYIELTRVGYLTVRSGYAWDGPSGPTVDTKTFMRGSLVHDALYQLMREDYLDHTRHRKQADLELYRICREDGMTWLRAQWVYLGVRGFARMCADPESIKILRWAP